MGRWEADLAARGVSGSCDGSALACRLQQAHEAVRHGKENELLRSGACTDGRSCAQRWRHAVSEASAICAALQRRAESQCRCGRNEASPSADVALCRAHEHDCQLLQPHVRPFLVIQVIDDLLPHQQVQHIDTRLCAQGTQQEQ